MLRDLLFALRRCRWDQLRYWRHTYSPFSPWRDAIARVVDAAAREASRYGVRARVDRRRAYQVARMVVSNRHGEHLADLLPDAYLAYSPPSAATFHAGRRRYPPAAERREAFLRHPQTLAYLLTPPRLARRGVGGSPEGGLVVIEAGETEVPVVRILERLRERAGRGPSDSELRAYAELLARLHAGIPAAAGGGEPDEDERRAA